jgi:hypothetical protein
MYQFWLIKFTPETPEKLYEEPETKHWPFSQFSAYSDEYKKYPVRLRRT